MQISQDIISIDSKEILQEALNLWWLRPENALALASYCIRGISLRPELNTLSADFACGDGVNTFFKTGGRFEKHFDIFTSVKSHASAKEIASKNIDVFDHSASTYNPAIRRHPDRKYTYAIDHKPALIEKATKLDFYQKHIIADLRDNVEDIQDESLSLVYCNSLYWVKESDVALKAIAQKVQPGGKIIIDTMTSAKNDITFANMLSEYGTEWCNLMDRGRQKNNPGIRSEAEWDKLFHNNGFTTIERKINIFPTAIGAVWNVGLRPIFPVLNKMVQSIDKNTRQSIKEEWVEIFTDLFHPILIAPELLIPSSNPVLLQYILVKK